jgi:hypothetical protein
LRIRLRYNTLEQDWFSRTCPREALLTDFSTFPYALALLGIPPGGAKSRVETQIKLDLHLLHPGTHELVKDAFNFLKLPSYGVSKEKFRLANLKGFSPTEMLKVLTIDAPKDLDSSKMLYLEASVVCTTQPTKTVFICEGCILREVPPRYLSDLY